MFSWQFSGFATRLGAALLSTSALFGCGDTDEIERTSVPDGGGRPDATNETDAHAPDARVDMRSWRTEEWTVSTPEEHGFDATVLERVQEYAFEEGRNTQGVVVVRNGVIAAEWYEDGADADSWGASWSVAKSFTSALVGIAIDE